MTKTTLIVLAILATIAFVLYISDDNQRELELKAQRYERCVFENYEGKTVMEVYYATGEYPECNE